TIAGLTIEAGRFSGGDGGAILNVSVTLTLTDDVLSNNETLSNSTTGSPALGGAVANENGATLTVTGCTFTANEVLGGEGGGRGFGGAIYNVKATATLTGSTFTGNVAQGGNGGSITSGHNFVGVAVAGAIDNDPGGSLTVAGCTFTANLARAGNGGRGGPG